MLVLRIALLRLSLLPWITSAVNIHEFTKYLVRLANSNMFKTNII